MKTATGTGRLFHKFHGTYWCIIVIRFQSAELAALAMAAINAAITTAFKALGEKPRDKEGKEIETIRQWVVSEKEPAAIHWNGLGNQLKIVKDIFIDQWGCKQPIDDRNHSIDYGDEFTIEVPIEEPKPKAGEKGEQLSLF